MPYLITLPANEVIAWVKIYVPKKTTAIVVVVIIYLALMFTQEAHADPSLCRIIILHLAIIV